MKNQKLTKLPASTDEIDDRKQEIAESLRELSSAILQRDELIAEYVSLIAQSHQERHRVHPPAGGHHRRGSTRAHDAGPD
jgi:hypothetical protein